MTVKNRVPSEVTVPFTICNGMFIVDQVLEVTGDAVHLLIDGVRKWGYLPSLEPEDREKILREANTNIITTSAAGPAPEVRPEAGGVAQSNLGGTAPEIERLATVEDNNEATQTKATRCRPRASAAMQSNITQEESMSHKQSEAQPVTVSTVTISAGSYTAEALHNDIQKQLGIEPHPQGKRTRTVRPRDPEAEAIDSITRAELKRNESQNKAKAAYDEKIDRAEQIFKLQMQDTLAELDEVTRARVGKWIADRYGTL